MNKKAAQYLMFMLVLFLCTSCRLMPVEEELPAAPVIRSYKGEEYRQASVQRGDLVLTKAVRCTCIPMRRENLSFSLGGVIIDRIYVSEGQQVQAGELLAELAMGDLGEQIRTLENELQVLKLKKEQLLEQQTMENQWQDTSNGDLLAGVEQQLREVEDDLYIQELRLEEKKAERQERQIYAGIDGTISYVQKIKSRQCSVKGETIIIISDKTTALFTVEGADALYFPIGTQTVIRCQDREFGAFAVEASGLGMPDKGEAGEPIAYLKMTEPDLFIKNGAEGSIRITLETREQVLYVSKKAIKTANGAQFVYMQDEDGLKIRQTVTTGLVSGDFIEITSGLAEGDRVIVE